MSTETHYKDAIERIAKICIAEAALHEYRSTWTETLAYRRATVPVLLVKKSNASGQIQSIRMMAQTPEQMRQRIDARGDHRYIALPLLYGWSQRDVSDITHQEAAHWLRHPYAHRQLQTLEQGDDLVTEIEIDDLEAAMEAA